MVGEEGPECEINYLLMALNSVVVILLQGHARMGEDVAVGRGRNRIELINLPPYIEIPHHLLQIKGLQN